MPLLLSPPPRRRPRPSVPGKVLLPRAACSRREAARRHLGSPWSANSVDGTSPRSRRWARCASSVPQSNLAASSARAAVPPPLGLCARPCSAAAAVFFTTTTCAFFFNYYVVLRSSRHTSSRRCCCGAPLVAPLRYSSPIAHRNGATSGAPQQQAAVLPPGLFSDFVCLVVRRFAEHDAKVQCAADGGTGAGGEYGCAAIW